MVEGVTDKKSRKISTILGFILCFPLLNYSIPYFGKLLLGDSSKLLTYVLFFLYWFASFYALYLVKFKVNYKKIIIIFSFFAFLAFSFLVNPKISQYLWTKLDDPLNPFYAFLMYSVSTFLISSCISNVEMVINKCLNFACLGIGLCFIYYIVILNKGEQLGYMTLSYNLLFPTIILLFYTIIDFKIHHLLFGILGLLMILFEGARGALISFVVPFVLFIVLQKNIKKSFKFIFFFAILTFTIVFLLNTENVYSWLFSVLDKMGLESRTLEKIFDSEFFTDSNRSIILVNVFSNSSILPGGLYYDRFICGGYAHSHNLIAEFICEYGYILGMLLLIALFVVIIKAFRKSDNYYKLLLFALLGNGLIKLMFSSSYLSGELYFFFLLGVCLDIVDKRSRHTVVNGFQKV